MSKLNQVHNLVYNILLEKPETRGDDFLLIYELFNQSELRYYDIEFLIKNHAQLGVPSLETITRCRRKIQEQYPELSGKKMREIRKAEERKFKDYALNR